jgi:hypothetical protein
MHIKNIHCMIEKLSEVAKCELDKGIEKVDTKEMGEVAEIIKELSEAEYYAKISKAMDEAEYGEDYDYMGAYDEHERRGYRGQPRSKTSGRFMSRRDRRRSYEEPMYYTMTPEMYHMYPSEYYRDMDREDMGRMYYSGGPSSSNTSSMGGQSSSGMSSSSGNRGYTDSRQSDGGNYSSRMQRDGMNESRYERARRGYEETKSMHKDNSSESKQMKMKSLEDYTKELASDITDMVKDMSAEEKNLLRTKLQTLAQKVQ